MKGKAEIQLSREGEIGFLALNNPPENYLEQPDFIDLDRLKEIVRAGIKALVVNGTGRYFSAGANIASIQNQIKDVNRFQERLIRGNELLNYIDALDIPVLAAISGVCFGAGLELALACDIRICDKQALFAFPEVNHNLIPGLGGLHRLAALTGAATALELVLHGDLISAQKAFELKIVDEVVEKKQAFSQAENLAKKITDKRPLRVINAVMRSIHNSKTMDNEEVIKRDAAMFTALAMDLLNDQNK